MEVEILRRTAASAAALSAAGGSTRRRSRRGGNIRSPRSWSPSGCRAPPIAATRRAPPSDRQAAERPAIAGICEKSRFRYGCRRVADTLRKAAGIRIADKTALKAVREGGCCSGPADAGGAASAWAGPAAPGARL
ncbi:transposase [Slackia sp.]|uniref:transposase n=1 Tax=Slackia sp. TaxID=2049041 RepID=UPI003A97450B